MSTAKRMSALVFTVGEPGGVSPAPDSYPTTRRLAFVHVLTACAARAHKLNVHVVCQARWGESEYAATHCAHGNQGASPLLSLRLGGGKSSMFTVVGATNVAGRLCSAPALATATNARVRVDANTAGHELLPATRCATVVPHTRQRGMGGLGADDTSRRAQARTQTAARR